MTPVIIAVAAIASLLICGLATWGAVAAQRRHRKRMAQRDAIVRIALYRALDEPTEPARIVAELSPADRKLLDSKARALLSALRGEDRESLARLLESRGLTEAARHQCLSWRAATRVAGCQLLGDVGSSFAVLDLVPLLDDPRPSVRLAAARALGRLGQPTAVTPLIGAVERGGHLPVDVAADAIQQIRDWPVSLLPPLLSDPSQPTRALAVELLGRFRSLDCIDALVELLEDDRSTEVRVRTARALGRIGSPRGVQPLIACTDSGPTELRLEAVKSLGRMGAAAAVPALRNVLLGDSLSLSQAAATSLSAIDPQGVVALQDIADDHAHPAAVTSRKALATRWALAAGLPNETTPLRR